MTFWLFLPSLVLLHKGLQVDKERKFLAENEFSLGAYEAEIMLLTHPERLVVWRNLWFECPGDEMIIKANDLSDQLGLPWFTVDHDKKGLVKFQWGRLGWSHGGTGSITGFLLK